MLIMRKLLYKIVLTFNVRKYFKCVVLNGFHRSVNQLLRQHSEQTAASFLYLPVPPDGDEATVYPNYLQLLTELTADLPPTVLVHGVSPVTSTAL